MNLKDRLITSHPQGDEIVGILSDLVEAVNDLRAKYTAHIAGTHSAADTTNTLSGSDVDGLEKR